MYTIKKTAAKIINLGLKDIELNENTTQDDLKLVFESAGGSNHVAFVADKK
jgi:hypothetical protein